MADIIKLVARIGDDEGPKVELKGRVAWAAAQLKEAGEVGCTPITHPGPRWSGYVHRLRGLGIAVETVTENHAGSYSGHHARYVLRTPLVILDEVRA